MRVLIFETGQPIDTVSAYAGRFPRMFTRLAGRPVTPDVRGTDLVDPAHAQAAVDAADAVLITGSPAMIDEAPPWLDAGVALVQHAVATETPLLGVCFGHQLLVHATGGTVGPNPRGRHMGSSTLTVTRPSPLFAGLGARFATQLTHRDAALSLGPDTTVLGTAPHDPHHAIRVGQSAFGVQFHPEFDVTVSGLYLDARGDLLDADRGPGTTRHARENLVPSEHASGIIARFFALAAQRRVPPR